jgi:hypothetical protein
MSAGASCLRARQIQRPWVAVVTLAGQELRFTQPTAHASLRP